MEYIHFFVLICILIVALVYDFSTYKIPNKLIIAGAVAGFILQLMEYSFAGLWLWMRGIVCILSIFLVLYYFSMMGAGDIKLFGIMGGLFGAKRSLVTIFLSFLIAAFIAMLLMIKRRNFRDRIHYFINFFKECKSQNKICYMDFKNKDKMACMHFTLPLLIAVLLMWVLEIFGCDF